MNLRLRMIMLLAGPVMYVASCSSPQAPPDQGSVVFRFDRGAQQARLVHAGGVADMFDSVAVSVFRPGSPIHRETKAGAALTVDPVEVRLSCVAEGGKRVSVELFASGVMLYHGFQEGVIVRVGQATAVTVDAYPFYVPSLTVAPSTVMEGGSFDMSWPATKGALTYRIEASKTPDFAAIEWQQSSSDTVATTTLPPGAHYFRVAPQTPYATGTYAGPENCYVLGGSGQVFVSGFDAPGVIPGDVVSVLGENLDYMDTQVEIGGLPMEIVSASWGELVVRMPRDGATNPVKVTSTLGSASSPQDLIALRVAYVTDGGGDADAYESLLSGHRDDFGKSGMAVVPVEDLDWRDMNAFDIILVAHDAGTTRASWGHGVPARAARISDSRANVVAIGLGGAVFLDLVGATNAASTTTQDADGRYYAPGGGSEVFNTPHSVGGGFVTMGRASMITVDFTITNSPAGVNLHASTDAGCLIVCNPNNRWALADFRVVNPKGASVIYFFWGYAGDPAELTLAGGNVFGNVMYLLHNNLAAVTP